MTDLGSSSTLGVCTHSQGLPTACSSRMASAPLRMPILISVSFVASVHSVSAAAAACRPAMTGNDKATHTTHGRTAFVWLTLGHRERDVDHPIDRQSVTPLQSGH